MARNIAIVAVAPVLLAAIWMTTQQMTRTEPHVPPAPPTPAPDSARVHTNRLVNEKSPYLLQHAHNPVDWYPWGEEAFAKARREDKPIFLSIGYSACHWCHVMAHESFENEEVAAILNQFFVSIKVDREERPDIDRTYMAYVQAMTGGGGWPMSVWLTPGLAPFAGGTYFPSGDRLGRPGLVSVLRLIAEEWRTKRPAVVAAGTAALDQLQQAASARVAPGTESGSALIERGYEGIGSSYEPQHGGFSRAPKFPQPVVFNFLLRYHARTGNEAALEMTLFTLRKMAEGGMHDQIGGGFHRYSVDTYWHVPHFEKMLYDQAQLASAYLEAFQISRDPFFADVARDILDYVLRDMTGPDGQFYSAEDADSPLRANPAVHTEGAFYVWEWQEITDALGPKEAPLFCSHHGVKPRGNAPDDPHGEFRNKNILVVAHTADDTARTFATSPDDVRTRLAHARATLFKLRAQRPRPNLDDKTLTDWNGLMISAFAQAYQVLEYPGYLVTATRAASFIRARLYDQKSGMLLHRYRAGDAAIEGYQEDYAFLIQGLLDLYEASFDVSLLSWAIALQKKQDSLFWDSNGGYFSTTGAAPGVLLRSSDPYDSAEPAGNSIAALNLLRLSRMTDSNAWCHKAEQTCAAYAGRIADAPHAMPQMLVAFDLQLAAPLHIVIAGRPDASDTQAMLRELHARFLPHKVIILADGGAGQKAIAHYIESIATVKMIDGKATAYVCKGAVCLPPTTNAATLASLLTGPRAEEAGQP